MGKSQRARKHEARRQEARKQTTTEASAVLSPELASELGEDVVVVVSDEPVVQRKKSSAQKKRIARAREKAAKFAERETLFAALQRNAATPEELEVLRATADAQRHGTAKNRAKAALLQERAHLPQEDDDDEPVVEPEVVVQEQALSAAELMMAQLAALKTATIETDPPQAEKEIQPMTTTEPRVAIKQTVRQRKRPREEDEDDEPLPRKPGRPLTTRRVVRSSDVQTERMKLPACEMEQEIVAAVNENEVVVISGETGSGKSTQVPQFLYEAGFDRVLVTCPRRVAAATAAKRVASELGTSLPGPVVGYRTRFDSKVGKDAKIIFETDGVLLRQLQRDILLRDYDVVCIDEAHERTLNTDVILGLLARAVPLRRRFDDMPPLKLVIMSASSLDDVVQCDALWGRHFPSPPFRLDIPGRQHPVAVTFAKETILEDYVTAAFEQTCHLIDADQDALRDLRKERNKGNNHFSGGILVFLTGKKEVLTCCDRLRAKYDNVVAVPLYAALALEEQERAFQTPGPGQRLVVVATNVAETSVTIPGISTVIDSGRVKRRVTSTGGALAYEVGWISQASAKQRAGRAGRVGPGEVYRLYSAAVFADIFPATEKPDVEVLPLEDLVLNTKAIGITDVTRFPFVTQPSAEKLFDAHGVLQRLGALDDDRGLTNWGTQLAALPVGVRCAAALAACADHHDEDLAAHCVAAVAALSEGSPFTLRQNSNDDDVRRSLVPAALRHPMGDAHARVRALVGGKIDDAVDPGALKRIDKLRRALVRAAAKVLPSAKLDATKSKRRDKLLARCILAGHLDRIARLADPAEVQGTKRFQTHCAYELLKPPRISGATKLRFASISRNSVLYARRRADLPEYLVYTELGVDDDGQRGLIHAGTAIDGAWIASLAQKTPFLEVGNPLDEPGPHLHDDKIAVFRRPRLPPWDLPLVPTDPPSNRVPHALARLLLTGAFFSSSENYIPPRTHTRLASDLFAFDHQYRPKKAAAVLALLGEILDPGALRTHLASDAAFARSLRSALLRCITGDASAFDHAFQQAFPLSSSVK